MKQNKKGFTLIELLAVIVILAIIALIAVPVVMNIITKARKSAAADSAYHILDAAELWYANQLLDNPTAAFNGKTFEFNDDGTTDPELEIKGTRPTDGSIVLDANGTATIGEALVINNFNCTAGAGGVITCADRS